MRKRPVVRSVGAAFLILTTWGAQALGAVDCGEPVPPPKYQVGEKWTWRDEKGQEVTDEVVQVEGDMTQIRWSDGDVASYDKDRVIRKVVRPNGETITEQGVGRYTTVGQKTLDFPLQVGKQWGHSFLDRPAAYTGVVRYERRYSVVACEEVLTAAGKFPALKVKVEEINIDYSRSGTYYFWYAPQVKQSVRRQFTPSGYWAAGAFRDNELIKFEVK